MKAVILRHSPAALVFAGTLLALSPVRAQTRLVTLNTSAFNGAGTFSVEFLLNNGAASADGNSTVAISNFSLTGGAVGTATPALGDVTGSLGSTLTLRDSNAATGGFADFIQGFTVNSGSSILSFNLNASATSVDSGTPDFFGFSILDPSGNPLATNATTGLGTGVELVDATFTSTSTSPVPMGFTTQATTTVSGASTSFPGITATVTTPLPVPEASTTISLGLLLAFGLGGLIVSARRKAPLLR